MMKLNTFIEEALPRLHNTVASRAYVREKGFTQLYVRVTLRYIEGVPRPCLDLANIEARRPGKGSFKALVSRLRKKYPQLTLFVECVQTNRFAGGLLRMGFKAQDEELDPSCFYLLPTMSLFSSVIETQS